MRLSERIIILSIFLSSLCGISHAYDLKNTYYIEAESFQFYGTWEASGVMREAVLFAMSAGCEASTVMRIREEGNHFVWARSMDYVKNQGVRRFTLGVNADMEILGEGGKHGKGDCLYWEKLGVAEFKKGDNFITLKSTTSFPRVDAILITKDKNFDPNIALQEASVRRATRFYPKMHYFEYKSDSFLPDMLSAKPDSSAKAVKISNPSLSVEFVPYKTSDGKRAFVRKVVYGNAQFSRSYFDECLSVSYAPEVEAIDVRYEIKWKPYRGTLLVNVGSDTFETPASSENRFAAGKNMFMRPSNVEKLSPLSVKLSYEDGSEAVYTLDKEKPWAKFDVNVPVKEDGMYSVALYSGESAKREDLLFTLMPPSYLGVRTMKEAAVLGNRIMSQPLSLMETKLGENSSLTNGVVADPTSFDVHEWSVNTGGSVCGFSLASPRGLIQPSICSPILGGRDSKFKPGDTIKRSWYVLDMRGDWTEALSEINSELYGAADLREPQEASLSDAAANMIEYLKSEEISGFSQRHKGRWNIEHINSVTVSSPLAEVSAALLSDDEDYYERIALPTIEYTLSRREPHFSVQLWSQVKNGDSPFIKLGALSDSYWSADYFAGLNNLLGFGNPFFKTLYKTTGGKTRYGGKLPWTVDLGIAIADPQEAKTLMPGVLKSARKWMESSFSNRYYGEPPAMGFVNAGFYPYWWYLIDLYEITRDESFLNYARLGSYYTLSCLWNWPMTVKGDFVVNKGGVAEGDYHPMWRGDKRSRLGEPECTKKKEAFFAAHPEVNKREWRNTWFLDEKVVDGRKVARTGLGIEQRWTYVLGIKNCRNIMMPSWAPEMLRVWRYSGDDIVMKFSRHSIVGRYANYPGYYICDYTDVMHSADYPYKGPDITSLYHHHAPCAFAHTVDYLMAQVEERSAGKINFPYVRQQGYVWFTNRIFGRPGTVFGDQECRPLLSNSAAKLGTSKISAIYARGKDFIWAIFLNDSGSEITADLKLNPADKIFKSAFKESKMKLFDSAGNELGEYNYPEASGVKIPALGLVALKVKAEQKELFPQIAPLKSEAHIEKKGIAKEWGDMHAFRIRSPFGKDSLYVVLTAPFDKKGQASIEVRQGEKTVSKKCSVFPYEFSIYPLNMQGSVSFKITVEDENSKKVSEEFTLGD